MAARTPRLFSDFSDWFEAEFPFVRTGMFGFRLEDYRDNGNYVIRAELPGMDPEKDIQITVERGVLDISAERQEETKEKYRSEFRYGSLHRSVRLPEGADETKIKAHYEKGILEVVVPMTKAEVPAGKAIPIERAS